MYFLFFVMYTIGEIKLFSYNEKRGQAMKKTLEKVKKLLPFIGIMLFAFAIYTLHKELAHMSFRDLRKAFTLLPI